MSQTVTLQVNVSGAWRNLVTFDSSRKAGVREAVKNLAAVMGTDAKWCFLLDNGKREWLPSTLAETFSKEVHRG